MAEELDLNEQEEQALDRAWDLIRQEGFDTPEQETGDEFSDLPPSRFQELRKEKRS